MSQVAEDFILEKDGVNSMKRTFTKYPKHTITASAFLPLGEVYNIINYAMDYLDQGKKVYIESGALNDLITGYVINPGADRGWTKDYDEVLFTSDGGTLVIL